MNRSQTYIAIPPGETIKEQLSFRGMSQKEFAIRMGLTEKNFSSSEKVITLCLLGFKTEFIIPTH